MKSNHFDDSNGIIGIAEVLQDLKLKLKTLQKKMYGDKYL